MKKRILCIFMAVCIAVSCFITANAVDTAKTMTSGGSTGAQSKIQGAAILHCFDWSYNSIKNNLQAIKDAGYTAVQTSPVQPPKDYNGNWRDQGGQWWKLYQPLGVRIADSGQSWLGGRSELQSLCSAAHNLGIKVVVDIVANHLADNGLKRNGFDNVSGAVDGDMRNSEYWRSEDIHADNDNDRYKVTHGAIDLPDLNTNHSSVQQKYRSLIADCASVGVDGFRFDAAKHIELPGENGGSDFWPTVLGGAPNAYSYGEILNYAGTDIGNYTQYMSITDNYSGDAVLKAVCDKNAQGAASGTYHKGGAANKSVLWVESHDTYMGGSGSAGISNTANVSNNDIIKAWAMVGSRADASALYFARPAANMGDASTDTTWKSNAVVQVNKFKNFFDGESEYLSSEGDCAYNERGTSGVVISKLNGGGQVSLTAHKMADGQYKDWVSGGTFTVSGGRISGNVDSSGVAVVYNAQSVPAGPSVSINYNGNNQGGNFYETIKVTLNAANTSSATYKLGNASAKSYTSGTVITIGSDMSDGASVTLVLTGNGTNGKTVTASYTFTKKARPTMSGNTVVFYDDSNSNWGNVCAYVYVDGNNNNAAWPGASMTDLGGGLWGYVIDDSRFPSANVIFASADGGAQHNGADEPGLPIKKGEWKIYSGGNWSNYEKPQQPTQATQQTQATQPTQSGTTYYYGDANCNGKVDINDVTMIQFSMIKMTNLTDLGKILADVDGDGKVKIQDANAIQCYCVRLHSQAKKTNTPYNSPIQPTQATQQTQPTQATQATQPSGNITIYFDQGDADGTPVARCFKDNYGDHTDYTMQNAGGSKFSVTIPSSFTKVEFRYNNGNQWTSWQDIIAGKTYNR